MLSFLQRLLLISILILNFAAATQLTAQGYDKFLQQKSDTFDKADKNNQKWLEQEKKREIKQRQENRAAAARASKNRDRSKDVCYQLPSGSDAQTACLGKYPNSVKNERARNILLGYCYSMGSSSELSNDLSYVCTNGISACSSFDDGDAAYHCKQCGATRSWLAVYSLGHVIQCFK
jgi:hypothetical protein